MERRIAPAAGNAPLRVLATALARSEQKATSTPSSVAARAIRKALLPSTTAPNNGNCTVKLLAPTKLPLKVAQQPTKRVHEGTLLTSEPGLTTEILPMLVKQKRQRLTGLTEEEKLARRKIKNRVAAQKSRDLRKAHMDRIEDGLQGLRARIDKLESENDELRRKCGELLHENTELRQQQIQFSTASLASPTVVENDENTCSPSMSGQENNVTQQHQQPLAQPRRSSNIANDDVVSQVLARKSAALANALQQRAQASTCLPITHLAATATVSQQQQRQQLLLVKLLHVLLSVVWNQHQPNAQQKTTSPPIKSCSILSNSSRANVSSTPTSTTAASIVNAKLDRLLARLSQGEASRQQIVQLVRETVSNMTMQTPPQQQHHHPPSLLSEEERKPALLKL